MSKIVEDTLKIGKQIIPVKRLEIEQAQLKYYPENPRIYSLVYTDEAEPSQNEIQEKLQAKEHVKVLKHSIKANGGLIDPIIVRDQDFVVLEGNSRLAAYRLLAAEDTIKWGKISAVLLPGSISDDLIFTLLGQYHIIGRKDWDPFEQAGYLWRRNRHYSIPVSTMSKEMGLSEGETQKLITIYDFMKAHDDINPQHWSYYEEYLKSRALKKYREEIPELDKRFTEMVKVGEIRAAIDVREKLQMVARIPGQRGLKLMSSLVECERTFEECYFEAEKSGATNNWYQTLYKFRIRIADPDVKRQLKKMPKQQQDKCMFELKKIEEAIRKLRNNLGVELDD